MKMTSDYDTNQLQIRFVTKQDSFSVPDSLFAVSSTVTAKELNDLLRQLLEEGNEKSRIPDFDFIAGGELLRSELGKHLSKKSISGESIVDVEYLERHPPPQALDCLLHDDWVSSVDVCRTAIVSACYDNTLHLWTTSGSHRLTVTGHSAPVKVVKWIDIDGPVRRFVSGSQDQNLMVWEWNVELNTVTAKDVCVGHSKSVESLAVSPSGTRFVSGSWDKLLKIWPVVNEDGDPENKKPRKSGSSRTIGPLVTLKGHKESVSGITWLNESEVATCSWDHTIRIWDVEMNSSIREIGGNKSYLSVEACKLNNLLATSSADKTIRLYDPRSQEGQIVITSLVSHKMWVSAVSWSTDRENLLVSGSYDNQVKLWDIRSPSVPLYDLMGHEDQVMCTNWSVPSFIVSGGSDNTLRIFKCQF